MKDQQPSRVDQMLNLLVEEIEERMRVRREPPLAAEFHGVEAPIPPVEPQDESVELAEAVAEPEVEVVEPVEAVAGFEGMEPEEGWQPPASAVSPKAARLMGRLALGLLVAIVLINIPLNRHGTTLATAMPDSAALIIRDGLVVKEEDDEEIYVLQDGKLRWISSLDAFEHFGFTWGDVHVVEDGFLDQFEKGTPLHVLLKCRDSPHIYRLEGGVKRWIVDIKAFEAEGHVWEDVQFVSCSHLRDLPDGETIPPGHGPPPQP